ncbi:hypothetical protein [Novosphingobium sp. P6W]|uniref:hypothetical protein n=1 Tax=Novosphingobium sp. P6W TaxID=1609758 RepID=UPI0013B3BF37|nr:hypothetical protein [Novosphingobium sp. P6W]
MMLQVSTRRHGCSGFRRAALDIELRREEEVWRMYREDVDRSVHEKGRRLRREDVWRTQVPFPLVT